jgi:adenine-specific DNA-methyltransferase
VANVSRLNDLLRELRTREPALAADLEREVAALADRRAFGLNFERHVPEAVELPGRRVRKGDKVRILPPRGQMRTKASESLWRVVAIDRTAQTASLQPLDTLSRRPAEGVNQGKGEQAETRAAALDDLVVVAEFRDPIFPGLVSTGRVERGGDKPFHTVINAENFHALQTLLFTHRGKVDAIYIDPPYNTGAKDWKYNNDYVEGDDLYRHSKWLAMMERRLLLAKELLNADESVLIVTIDEKEVHRLALLVEQVFPETKAQLVSIVINPSGTSRELLSRVEEYAIFVFIGSATPDRVPDNLLTDADVSAAVALPWESLLRRGNSWYREERPNLCYPVKVDPNSRAIVGVGSPFVGDDEDKRPTREGGFELAWPVRTDGRLGIWRKDGRGLMALVEHGYAFASARDVRRGTWTIKYLMSGTVDAIASGQFTVARTGASGEVEVITGRGKGSIAKTVWNRPSHNAGMHGSALLRELIPNRQFPFPKSLYAVEDALRIVTASKPSAVIVDFFCGSGTTAHAVMRLNKQDGGRRQSISITNNEVAADEHRQLSEASYRPGDPEWERHGVCEYITKPRIAAAITGRTANGELLRGNYKFSDESPMADGFEENAEFFTLSYEAPLRVSSNREFAKIAPLLWIRAGSSGRRVEDVSAGWDVADSYGVLANLDYAQAFLKAVSANSAVAVAYIVTDEDRLFESVAQELPSHVEPVRLYESYLRNFEIESGRGAL